MRRSSRQRSCVEKVRFLGTGLVSVPTATAAPRLKILCSMKSLQTGNQIAHECNLRGISQSNVTTLHAQCSVRCDIFDVKPILTLGLADLGMADVCSAKAHVAEDSSYLLHSVLYAAALPSGVSIFAFVIIVVSVSTFAFGVRPSIDAISCSAAAAPSSYGFWAIKAC